MATRQQIVTRIRNGESGPVFERDMLRTIGCTPYLIGETTAGWRDTVKGEIRLVGRFLSDVQIARLLLLNDADASAGATAAEVCTIAVNSRA